MSNRSLSVSSTTWSFVSSSSASGIVGSSSAIRPVIGIVWHISNVSTNTSSFRSFVHVVEQQSGGSRAGR